MQKIWEKNEPGSGGTRQGRRTQAMQARDTVLVMGSTSAHAAQVSAWPYMRARGAVAWCGRVQDPAPGTGMGMRAWSGLGRQGCWSHRQINFLTPDSLLKCVKGIIFSIRLL
jgi:hypothetical protein